MTKKVIAILLVMLLLTMVGCGKNETDETQVLLEATLESAATETTEVAIPGIEDSIFDEESEETVETLAKEEVKPTESLREPDGPADRPETETTVPPASAPEETQGESPESSVTEYERFQAMSPAEQQAYVESFESIDLFFEWYNSAKEEYEAANPPIDVGDGSIDLGEIAGGNG